MAENAAPNQKHSRLRGDWKDAVKNAKGHTTEGDLSKEVTMTAPVLITPPPLQYISFTSDVSPASAKALLAACAQCASNGIKHVYLLLSTPGGDVREGMALYNILKGMPFDLTTHNVANVDSIGNVIFLAGKTRYACSSATFMFHGVAFNVEKSRLERRNLKEMTGAIDADTTRMSAVIAEQATFPKRSAIARLFLEASTKDAVYAKANGIVHDIRDVQIPPNTPVFQVTA